MKEFKTKDERKQIYFDLSKKTDETVLFGESRKKYTCWKLLLKAGFTGFEHNEAAKYNSEIRKLFPEYWQALNEYFKHYTQKLNVTDILFVKQEHRESVLLRAAEICIAKKQTA